MTEPEQTTRRDVLQALALGGVATAVLASSKSSAATAGEVAVAKVPAPIKEAADRLVKGARWTSAQKYKDEGADVYELFGHYGKAHDVSVEITAGKVTSIEREIDVADVPKTAMEAVTRRMKAFKPDTVLEMHHGDDVRDLSKAEVLYQLNGTAAKGKDLTVTVSPAGKITSVKREMEMTEVPKTITEALTAKAPRFKPEMVHSVKEENKLVGYLFAGKNHWVAFVSDDGKEIHLHKDEEK